MGEAYPWAPLRPDAQVYTAQTLLSLPGYRSEIILDSGVQLTLWGNVPQLCGFPPLLLESTVMLNAPEKGIDLDVTLERGRIKLASRKESGPAHVRLRFLREVWDVTLPDATSEVCAELWTALLPADPGAKRKTLPLSLGIFIKGSAVLRTARSPERQELKDRSRVSWINAAGAPLFRAEMPELPGWWSKPPDVREDRVADVMISLEDWAGRLEKTGEVVETIQTAIAAEKDPTFRELGMFFLASLDAAPYLVNHLEDGRHARVRRAAAHGLRAWLCHGTGRDAELMRLLQVRVNSAPRATLTFRLLHPLGEEERKRPDTYQQLIAHLDDEGLAVRELASWHLEELVPGGEKIPYNPAEPVEKRRAAVEEWKKVLPPGKLPEPPR
jgi:hypothetical protein